MLSTWEKEFEEYSRLKGLSIKILCRHFLLIKESMVSLSYLTNGFYFFVRSFSFSHDFFLIVTQSWSLTMTISCFKNLLLMEWKRDNFMQNSANLGSVIASRKFFLSFHTSQVETNRMYIQNVARYIHIIIKFIIYPSSVPNIVHFILSFASSYKFFFPNS